MYNEHIIYKKVKDFSNLQTKEIALRYANTPYNWSFKAIATEYSRDGEYTIKPRTISKLIQKAVKTALVNESIAIKIKEKAVFNAARHSKYSAMVTSDKYDELIKIGYEFIKNGNKHISSPTSIQMGNYESSEIYSNHIKEEELSLINQISYIEHQISTYSSNYTDDFPDTLHDLINKKNNLKEKLRLLKYYNPP